MNKTALASTGDRRSDRPESLPTRSPLATADEVLTELSE